MDLHLVAVLELHDDLLTEDVHREDRALLEVLYPLQLSLVPRPARAFRE